MWRWRGKPPAASIIAGRGGSVAAGNPIRPNHHAAVDIAVWRQTIRVRQVFTSPALRRPGYGLPDHLMHRLLSILLLLLSATPQPAIAQELGRASCRERVCNYVSISVVGGSLKKKNN